MFLLEVKSKMMFLFPYNQKTAEIAKSFKSEKMYCRNAF